jgi:hypothetical protein
LYEGYWFYVSANENVLSGAVQILENSPFVLADDLSANCDSGLHGERILSSELFRRVGDADEAIWLATDAIGLLNGITLLVSRDLGQSPIKLTRAFKDNGALPMLTIPVDEPGFFVETMASVAPMPRFKNARSVGTDLISLAASDTGIYYLLRLFSFDMTWGNIYKILETIETLAIRDGFDLKIGKSERDALTNTANNFSLTGLEARHGLKLAGKPNNSPRATRAQAFNTVRTASRRYLQSRLA